MDSKNTNIYTLPENIFNSAKEVLLSSSELTEDEKLMLNRVSLRVDQNDGMYLANRPGSARHYLSVGLSAIRCINLACDKSLRKKPIRSVMDFPSGYGRVTRFLKAQFPSANITVSEIQPQALNFCESEFSAKPVASNEDFSKLSLDKKFDLIWCGSLFTHIDEKSAIELLKFFDSILEADGLCVFTAHGATPLKWIQEKSNTYGLPEESQQELLSQFQLKEYGYGNYSNVVGYGISVVSYARMLAMVHENCNWNEVMFMERGWDNHQDVYAFIKR